MSVCNIMSKGETFHDIGGYLHTIEEIDLTVVGQVTYKTVFTDDFGNKHEDEFVDIIELQSGEAN